MTRTTVLSISVARPVIRALTVLNIIYGLCLLVLLGFSFTIDGWPARPLGFDLSHAHPWIGTGLRAIVVVGIAGAAVVHTILRRLLAIVDTVRDGGPFVEENSKRLEQIAWRVLALEGLRLAVAGIAAVVWESGHIEAFSFAPWLAVLLLFVLAGVFSQGARMSAELEGTI